MFRYSYNQFNMKRGKKVKMTTYYSFRKLFTTQRELDYRIETKHHLENEALFDKKILALLVELGECANETRCFKFWSVKKAAPRKTILEEYVDGLHFILSLGLELDVKNYDFYPNSDPVDKVDQFQKVYQAVVFFKNEHNVETYEKLFSDFMTLGFALEFEVEEIIEAYYDKNKINHKRQDNNY